MSPCSQAAPLSKHLGEPTNLGGSRSQGCHGYLLAVPVVLSPPSPADLQGTSSQAHRLAMSLNVSPPLPLLP